MKNFREEISDLKKCVGFTTGKDIDTRFVEQQNQDFLIFLFCLEDFFSQQW
jgi:hypothetical protein